MVSPCTFRPGTEITDRSRRSFINGIQIHSKLPWRHKEYFFFLTVAENTDSSGLQFQLIQGLFPQATESI